MRRLAPLLVFAVAASGAAGSASGAQPGCGPGCRSRIVFETTRATRPAGLVVMNADGSHRARLAGANAGDVVVTRGAFAFARLVSNEYRVIVTDSRGTRDLGRGRPVAFSPDGRTVVAVGPDSSWRLLDRGTGAVGATFPVTMSYLGWSPGGLLWSRGTDVVVTQSDGSAEHTAAQHVFAGSPGPRWSPDGVWIAYAAQPDPSLPLVLRLVRADGTDDHALGSIADGFAWSPDGTRIAFATPKGELAFASPDGTTHATGAPAGGGFAFGALGSWSPDGTRFAFPTKRNGPLAVISTATDATHIVTRANDLASISWSPDGRKLLLLMGDNIGVAVVPASATGNKPKLLVHVIDGAAWLSDGRVVVDMLGREVGLLGSVAPTGGHVRLLPGTEWQREPAWSPGHSKLAFASFSEDTGLWTISVANADGSHRLVVARSAAVEPSPTWSPDGRFVAYAGESAIYVVAATGGRPRRVTAADVPWTVAWSPDGKRIAFGTSPEDSDFADIVLVDPDGSHRRTVVHGEAGLNWGGVAWSPDSRVLAVARRSDEGGDPDGVPDLYLVDVRTHRQTEIGLDMSDPSFSPDGRQLAATVDDGTIVVLNRARGWLGHTVGTGTDPTWSRS